MEIGVIGFFVGIFITIVWVLFYLINSVIDSRLSDVLYDKFLEVSCILLLSSLGWPIGVGIIYTIITGGVA